MESCIRLHAAEGFFDKQLEQKDTREHQRDTDSKSILTSSYRPHFSSVWQFSGSLEAFADSFSLRCMFFWITPESAVNAGTCTNCSSSPCLFSLLISQLRVLIGGIYWGWDAHWDGGWETFVTSNSTSLLSLLYSSTKVPKVWKQWRCFITAELWFLMSPQPFTCWQPIRRPLAPLV